MKYLFFIIICLSFISLTLLGGDDTHINRGHNQIEIEHLQSIDISPVFDVPSSKSIDMTAQDDGEVLHVSKKAILTLQDITRGEVSNHENVFSLNLTMTKTGSERIKEFTSKNVEKRLAFVVNGNLIKAPRVRVPIEGLGLSINPLDKNVAEYLASEINTAKR